MLSPTRFVTDLLIRRLRRSMHWSLLSNLTLDSRCSGMDYSPQRSTNLERTEAFCSLAFWTHSAGRSLAVVLERVDYASVVRLKVALAGVASEAALPIPALLSVH